MKQKSINLLIILFVFLLILFFGFNMFVKKENITFERPILNNDGEEADKLVNSLNDNIYIVHSDISNNMFSDTDASNIFLDTSGNMISQILDYIKKINTKIDKPPKLKCLADYETQLGGNLCCGQKGTLRGTQYVCPKEIPYCKSMQCGSKYGECSTVK
jgi:hypothetical protein